MQIDRDGVEVNEELFAHIFGGAYGAALIGGKLSVLGEGDRTNLLAAITETKGKVKSANLKDELGNLEGMIERHAGISKDIEPSWNKMTQDEQSKIQEQVKDLFATIMSIAERAPKIDMDFINSQIARRLVVGFDCIKTEEQLQGVVGRLTENKQYWALDDIKKLDNEFLKKLQLPISSNMRSAESAQKAYESLESKLKEDYEAHKNRLPSIIKTTKTTDLIDLFNSQLQEQGLGDERTPIILNSIQNELGSRSSFLSRTKLWVTSFFSKNAEAEYRAINELNHLVRQNPIGSERQLTPDIGSPESSQGLNDHAKSIVGKNPNIGPHIEATQSRGWRAKNSKTPPITSGRTY
jgi:hypothetical protein